MNKLKSYFLFSREHRSGILLLVFLIISSQIIYFFVSESLFQTKEIKEDKAWLLVQNEIDSLKQIVSSKKDTIYPFNPNFITDYKGYKLGLTVAEIDRLHQFRKQNKYVNSAKEFQNVTKVSNEILNKIEPYFKFPNWVNNTSNSANNKFKEFYPKEKSSIIQKEINISCKNMGFILIRHLCFPSINNNARIRLFQGI